MTAYWVHVRVVEIAVADIHALSPIKASPNPKLLFHAGFEALLLYRASKANLAYSSII
jgi:hypothetical protein